MASSRKRKLHPTGTCIACDDPGRSRSDIAEFLEVKVLAAWERVHQLRAEGDRLREESLQLAVGSSDFEAAQVQMLTLYGRANGLAQTILMKKGHALQIAEAHGFTEIEGS